MKKLLYAVLMVLIASSSYAAINESSVWEVRGDATAGNVNGCGFVSGTGTDYSQAATCKISFVDGAAGECAQASATNTEDDLTCTDASPSVCSSATYSFVDADVGNILHITSGTSVTAGWYEIVSVSSGSATLDRDAGPGAASTAITARIGGACSLGQSTHADRDDADFFAQLVAGQTVYIRSGSTVTIGIAITGATAGTETTPIKIIGYNATSGRSVRPTGTDRPSLSAAVALTMANYYRIQDFILTSTVSGAAVFTSGTFNVLDGIKVNCNTTTNCIGMGLNTHLINSEVSNASEAAPAASSGNIAVAASGVAFGNYIHGGGTSVRITGANTRIINNVISDPTRTAIYASTAQASMSIMGNTLYGQATPSAPAMDLSTPTNSLIMNNIFYGFTAGVSSATNFGSTLIDYNLYSNMTATYGGVAASSAGSNETALDPSLDANFAITNASARSLAFPTTFPGLSTNYLDHGAIQMVPSSGGGGGASAW